MTAAACPLSHKRVTVVGLGRFGGGLGVTKWLSKQGAIVTVSDLAGPDRLAESIGQLEGLDVKLHLGEHRDEDFLKADLLVVNPAVPPEMPLLNRARQAGVAETTEINLFLQRCPAPIVGITGSSGKSTTTAMIGQILSTVFTTHVGGNIGRSLLEDLEQISPGHVVVLELSSFQLERTALVKISPHVAVVTNLSANHLDRHKTMAAYAEAKKNIFRFQSSNDVLILNRSDRPTLAWSNEAPSRTETFDANDEPFELNLVGGHNQANAQAAWSACREFGIERDAAATVLKQFKGLDHRLQLIAEIDSVRYYNDSKCTTPEGAICALEAFEPRRTVIIVGGYDKGADFDELGKTLADRAKCVIAIGATQEKIVQAAASHCDCDKPEIIQAADLAEAVKIAKSKTLPNDAVLLSPACASYDNFTDYRYRGEEFVRLVIGN